VPSRRDPKTKTARDAVIVSAKRTPFGAFGGLLKDVPATDLGAKVIRAVVGEAGLRGPEVDYVYMGQVVQAGCGQIPSRQACLKAGLPVEVPTDTINKVCASSLRAANIADSLIRLGEADIVVAGGMENMSQGPYLVPQGRWGHRLELHFLPTYSPETNPIERIWWHLHQEITRNHRCRSLDELIDLTFEWLEHRQPFAVEDQTYQLQPAA
jgi:acetyl-CoA acetyltransferase